MNFGKLWVVFKIYILKRVIFKNKVIIIMFIIINYQNYLKHKRLVHLASKIKS